MISGLLPLSELWSSQTLTFARDWQLLMSLQQFKFLNHIAATTLRPGIVLQAVLLESHGKISWKRPLKGSSTNTQDWSATVLTLTFSSSFHLSVACDQYIFFPLDLLLSFEYVCLFMCVCVFACLLCYS
ncbi:hypothetical protein N1851_022775 [Merluccius polli]|uniref:Uncharacterized protein n=1 Tax=Merluccius polli TaxID=89951 RepID=A0AA47NWX0_MERPO|nr:hypothetical protein N1851_022775 [Merluccius polli]